MSDKTRKTKKMVKTLLFTLIIAILLPFSVVNFVEATSNENTNEKTKYTKDIEKIQKAVNDHKKALKKAVNDEERMKFQKGIDRLVLSEKILKEIKLSNSETTLQAAQTSTDLIRQYVKELEATYENEVQESTLPELHGSTVTPTMMSHGSTVTPTMMSHGSTLNVNLVSNHNQSAVDCSTNQTMSGSVVTNYKSWTNGDATISSSFNYPSTFSERDFPWSDCITFDHNRTTEKHFILTSWIPGADPGRGQACHTEVFSSRGSDSTPCSNFGPALITVVILDNEYGNGLGVQLGWIGGGVLLS